MNDNTIGAYLRQARHERGLTQEGLAELAGVGRDIIAKLEQGGRESARIGTLSALANALGITLSALLGRRERLEQAGATGILAVRDALLSARDVYPGIGDPDEEEPSKGAVIEAAVRRGWDLYWAGELGDLARMLPGLIGDAKATAAADGPRAAKGLAQAYQLAADLMVHAGNDDLALIAAERALAASATGDDELQHATLAGTASWVMLHQARHDDAERIARAAAQAIEPQMSTATPEHLTVWGALLLTAAAPAAAAARGDDVKEYIGLARAAAGRFGIDRHDYWTSFGPTQVAMQACYTSVVLGQPGAALKAAKDVHRENLLPISWGAHNLDIAQALAGMGTGKTRQATAALMEAHEVSPEWFRHQGLARGLVRDLVRRQQRLSEPLKTLATTVGGE